MGNLADRAAIVSGSGRGIGRALALKLAREGAAVVVNDLDEQCAVDTVAYIAAEGGRAVACAGDVTDQAFAARFVQTALEHFGQLDLIINNAGYTWDNVIQKMSDQQFQAMLDVHLMAPFRILRAAAEYLRGTARKEAQAGQEVFRKVVNIASIAGIYGNAGQVNYASAKAGVIGLTKAMAKEWGRYKINVNCVAFGLIATRLTQALGVGASPIDIQGRSIAVGVQPHVLAGAAERIAFGRPGTQEEAANAVYLLCTPESNYITGQVLEVSGGFAS
jgi:3-oxoacyl-[acyl-carrier protein] reductase